MATEDDLRATLAEIDELRREAKVCEDMHTYWSGHDGEFVELWPMIVRRRWRRDKQIYAERVMSSEERTVFRSWLVQRKGQLLNRADSLADSLKGTVDV